MQNRRAYVPRVPESQVRDVIESVTRFKRATGQKARENSPMPVAKRRQYVRRNTAGPLAVPESGQMGVGTQKLDALFIEHLTLVGGGLERAMERCGVGRLVVHAGSLRLAFLDDQAYPFRPNPWFSWLVPLREVPDSLLVWEPGQRPRLILVVPDDYWHSPPSAPQGAWVSRFELELQPDAASALARLPSPGNGSVWIGEPAPPPGAWLVNPPALLQELEELRTRKDAYELACLREATRLAVAGHLAVERAFDAGASEYEMHLAFLAATGHAEAELPYGNIIACNEHAATLHYQLLERAAPALRHNLLIDAGSTCRGYASDITRTWPAQPGGVFATLVRRLDAVQQGLCRAVRPGLDWRELHLRAHHEVAGLLREAGVLRLTAETAVAQGVSAAFLPHGLGHLLGLQVHDVGGKRDRPGDEPIPAPAGHPSLRMTRRLEVGFVVTVEPGIYFIPSLLGKLREGPFSGHVDWSLVDTLLPCGGVRIEDDVHVTPDGQENLTRPAFAAATAIARTA
jgi:Xaa-Pro dipeptidase